MPRLPDPQVATLKDAAGKLTGAKRRAFQTQVTLDYLEDSAGLGQNLLLQENYSDSERLLFVPPLACGSRYSNPN